MFQNPTFSYYFPKISWAAALPAIIYVMGMLDAFESNPVDDLAAKCSLAALLGLGLWNLRDLASVKGRSIGYRFMVGLFQGLYMGAFILLIDFWDGGDASATSMLNSYGTMAFIFGGAMAVCYKGKPEADTKQIRSIGVFIAILLCAHVLVLMSLWNGKTATEALFAPTLIFASSRIPIGRSLNKTENAVWTVMLVPLVCISFYLNVVLGL